MPEPVCRFLELLRESDNPRLRDAFRRTTPQEERAFEIIDQLYAGSTDPSLIAELGRYVPNLPQGQTPDAMAFYAEGVLEGQIARRNGVENDLAEFLKEFGQR